MYVVRDSAYAAHAVLCCMLTMLKVGEDRF